MAQQDVEQINELMTALRGLREAEQKLSEMSLRYMRLNSTDMRALQLLIMSAGAKMPVTPSAISKHLGISSASTTKLLDRLERGGHITRSAHPTDRRSLTIAITPRTHEAAMQTVGRQQSKRFNAAVRLSRQERETVIEFLRDMTAEITPSGEPWPELSGSGTQPRT